MESIDKYLNATLHRLAVEEERYGGGWRAMVAPGTTIDFVFDMLGGDDIEGTQMQFFLSDNPLFPSARGQTPSEALGKLDVKLSVLYRFQFLDKGNWRTVAQFNLLAHHDSDPDDESLSSYQVEWGDVIQDLRSMHSETKYFYDEARDRCSATQMRDLHALLNFKYEGVLAQLIKI